MTIKISSKNIFPALEVLSEDKNSFFTCADIAYAIISSTSAYRRMGIKDRATALSKDANTVNGLVSSMANGQNTTIVKSGGKVEPSKKYYKGIKKSFGYRVGEIHVLDETLDSKVNGNTSTANESTEVAKKIFGSTPKTSMQLAMAKAQEENQEQVVADSTPEVLTSKHDSSEDTQQYAVALAALNNLTLSELNELAFECNSLILERAVKYEEQLSSLRAKVQSLLADA